MKKVRACRLNAAKYQLRGSRLRKSSTGLRRWSLQDPMATSTMRQQRNELFRLQGLRAHDTHSRALKYPAKQHMM